MRFVVITGGPGSEKSTLIAELRLDHGLLGRPVPPHELITLPEGRRPDPRGLVLSMTVDPDSRPIQQSFSDG